MTKDKLLEYLNCGREIEFKYNGKMYSITQGMLNGKHVFSFCEFEKESTEVEKAIDVLDIKRGGVSVLDMVTSFGDDNLWFY